MPASQQIEKEIVALEAAIEPAKIELDRLYAEFGKSLPADVESWVKRSIQRRIEENAEKINAGGIEPLRRIKADLNELVQRLPEICSGAIGTPEQWPHRTTEKDSGQHSTRQQESHAAASYRRAISPLGALLAKHGLLAEKPGYVSEWEKAGNDQYRYAINPSFDERRFPALVEYQQKRQMLSQQHKVLETKRQELVKARARELWNDA
mgnify:CR=1 FL=1